LFVPGTSSWRRLFLLFHFGVPWSTAAKDTVDVVKFEGNVLPDVVFCFFWDFFRVSPFSWLQPRQLAECAASPSANWQLQHVGVEETFSLSGQYLCKWMPPHHKQRESWLQFAQTWPNVW
jgi:hypothetical protein